MVNSGEISKAANVASGFESKGHVDLPPSHKTEQMFHPCPQTHFATSPAVSARADSYDFYTHVPMFALLGI
jgi:hypothetical protein